MHVRDVLIRDSLSRMADLRDSARARENCDECGFDAAAWDRARAVAELEELGATWRDGFGAYGRTHLTRRPSPAVWSAVEYTVHTTKILDWWHAACTTLAEGGVVVLDPDGYPDADVHPYNEVPVDDALAQLGDSARSLATFAAGASEAALATPIRFDMPGVAEHYAASGIANVEDGVIHAAHDALHHLDDIARGLADVPYLISDVATS